MGSDGVPRVRRKSIELDSHLFLNGIASNDPDVVIQPAEYDGTGRRMKKVVTNSVLVKFESETAGPHML